MVACAFFSGSSFNSGCPGRRGRCSVSEGCPYQCSLRGNTCASSLEVQAAFRGTSVYFPDRAVPMLPVELSTDICSLRPQVNRLVLSALLELDHRGDVVGQEFCTGVIRSAFRMTYTGVHRILEENEPHPLRARFEAMRELALILNRKRTKRGSIDFDLPEPLVEFNEFGEMTGVTRSPRNIAHRIIEEFMLAANESVAAHIESAGVASIYRIHEPPDGKRVMDFEEVATKFGYSLGVGAIPVRRYPVVQRNRDGSKSRRDVTLPEPEIAVSSKMYQKLVAKIAGKPEERILSYLMLRSLKQARYSERNVGHFALAAPSYTHFTSPIRRYPDLIVHRILKAMLAGESTHLTEGDLRAIANDTSDTERRAAEAERELVEWKKVKFMIDRVGDEFAGLIISTTRFGFFVELNELFVEGLVPIDTLPGDRYMYNENSRKIVGQRNKRTFSMGDAIEVRLDRVDGVEKKLNFSVVEPRGGGKGKRGKVRQ
ncbi:MAG: VacB/RNase II family 3'-5' exoribonuclease [Bryobacteraceae bacterium]